MLRPATVYGPGSVEVVGEIAKAIRGRHMLLIGGGRAVAGLCYVENLLDAIVLALDAPVAPPGPFNVTDGLDVTWRRFTADLASGLGAPPPRLSLPYRPAAALAWALESAYRLARRATGLRDSATALPAGRAGARTRPGLRQPPRPRGARLGAARPLRAGPRRDPGVAARPGGRRSARCGRLDSATPMRIHALTTGSVRVKHSFLFPSAGVRRQLDLFLPGDFSEPLPIHCWAVEHEDRLLLVDTGETAAARDIAFARFDVTAERELPAQLEQAGLAIGDVDAIVLTHHHGDHVDGLIHVDAPSSISAQELRFARAPFSAVMRRVLRQPLPAAFRPSAFELADGPFGAFDQSRSLSADGRIRAVPTPGHTPGHVSVICVEDDGTHVMLAGDVTDTLEQLHAMRADAIGPSPAVHRATLARDPRALPDAPDRVPPLPRPRLRRAPARQGRGRRRLSPATRPARLSRA